MNRRMDRHEKAGFLKAYEDFDPPSDPERTGDDPRYLLALHIWDRALRYSIHYGTPTALVVRVNTEFQQAMGDRRAAGNPR